MFMFTRSLLLSVSHFLNLSLSFCPQFPAYIFSCHLNCFCPALTFLLFRSVFLLLSYLLVSSCHFICLSCAFLLLFSVSSTKIILFLYTPFSLLAPRLSLVLSFPYSLCLPLPSCHFYLPFPLTHFHLSLSPTSRTLKSSLR